MSPAGGGRAARLALEPRQGSGWSPSQSSSSPLRSPLHLPPHPRTGAHTALSHLSSIILCAELVLNVVVAERRLLDAGDGHRRLLLRPRAVPAYGRRRVGGWSAVEWARAPPKPSPGAGLSPVGPVSTHPPAARRPPRPRVPCRDCGEGGKRRSGLPAPPPLCSSASPRHCPALSRAEAPLGPGAGGISTFPPPSRPPF